MKRTSLVIIAILILSTLFSAAAFGTDEKEPETLDEALQQIAALKADLEALRQDYDTLQAAYDELQALLDEAEDIDYSNKDIVKLVQQALNDAGYNCGTPDGDAGSRTVESIKGYQAAHSLKETGEINRSLVQALGIYDAVRDLSAQSAASVTESRSSTLPQEYTLRDGKYIVGEDIAPGEYTITCIETEGEELNNAYTSLGGLYDALGEDDGWGALFGSLGDVIESVSPVTVNILGDYGSVIKTFDLKKDDTTHISLNENTALEISGGKCSLISE